MLHVWHFVSVKTLNSLVKRTSPRTIVTKKMYKQISSVHGSSVLTVTSVIFCITKLSVAQTALLNLWWKEVVMELENDQHVRPEANLSRFPFNIFNLSGFSTLLVTTCLLKGLFTQDFYHGTTTIYNTKTISCTVRATY